MSLTEDLRKDPSCIEITFAGDTRPFLLSVYGAKQARDEMGVDFVERLLSVIRDLGVAYSVRVSQIRQEKAVEGEAPDENEDVEVPWTDLVSEVDLSTKELEALAAVVYAGLVPFDEDIEPKQIEMRLTVATITDLLPQIGPTLFSFLQDQAPGTDDLSEAAANGEVRQDLEDSPAGKSPSRASSTSSTPKG